MPMTWLNDLEDVLSTSTSPKADLLQGIDAADVDTYRNRIAEVIARHPALVDLLPTSGTWELHSLSVGISCTTERLLSTLIDGVVDTANHAASNTLSERWTTF